MNNEHYTPPANLKRVTTNLQPDHELQINAQDFVGIFRDELVTFMQRHAERQGHEKTSQQELPLTHAATAEGRLFAAYDAARRRGLKQETFSDAMKNQPVARVLQMAAEARA